MYNMLSMSLLRYNNVTIMHGYQVREHVIVRYPRHGLRLVVYEYDVGGPLFVPFVIGPVMFPLDHAWTWYEVEKGYNIVVLRGGGITDGYITASLLEPCFTIRLHAEGVILQETALVATRGCDDVWISVHGPVSFTCRGHGRRSFTARAGTYRIRTSTYMYDIVHEVPRGMLTPFTTNKLIYENSSRGAGILLKQLGGHLPLSYTRNVKIVGKMSTPQTWAWAITAGIAAAAALAVAYFAARR